MRRRRLERVPESFVALVVVVGVVAWVLSAVVLGAVAWVNRGA